MKSNGLVKHFDKAHRMFDMYVLHPSGIPNETFHENEISKANVISLFKYICLNYGR